jgi:hypothetical protein
MDMQHRLLFSPSLPHPTSQSWSRACRLQAPAHACGHTGMHPLLHQQRTMHTTLDRRSPGAMHTRANTPQNNAGLAASQSGDARIFDRNRVRLACSRFTLKRAVHSPRVAMACNMDTGGASAHRGGLRCSLANRQARIALRGDECCSLTTHAGAHVRPHTPLRFGHTPCSSTATRPHTAASTRATGRGGPAASRSLSP